MRTITKVLRQVAEAHRLQQSQHVRRGEYQACHPVLIGPKARIDHGGEIAVSKLNRSARRPRFLHEQVHDLHRVSRADVQFEHRQ